MNWDIERLRTIAGLETPMTLQESWDEGDDDGDEDEDVKRADKEAKKRGIKLPKVKVDVEKDLHALAKSRKSADLKKEEEAEKEEANQKAAYKAEKEKEAKEHSVDDAHEEKESPAKEKAEHGGKTPSPAAEKKETPTAEKKEEAKSAAKPSEKKEEPKAEEKKEEAAEAKRRGKAPNADSKRQRLHAYLKGNPGVKRSVAMKWAQENLEMGAAYASQQIQAVKAQIVKEAFMLYHPSIQNFVLHENKRMGIFQWISENDTDSDQEPLMFATEKEAMKVANYLHDFNNQLTDIKRINLDA